MSDDYKIRDYHIGEIVRGKVVLITDDTIFVNIGAKSEAELPLQEYPDAKIEDVINCMIVGRTKSGSFRLSYKQALLRVKQEEYKNAVGKEIAMTGTIKEVIKGGILVDDGLKVFIPNSQLIDDIRNAPDKYLGKNISFFVIDRAREDFVGSQIRYERKKIKITRENFWENLDVDKVYTVEVKKVFPNKAFVEIDYVRGFITANNFSYEWIESLEDKLNEGDTIEVKILNYDRRAEKIEFTRKPLLEDPEPKYLKKYTIGSIHKGEVVKVFNDFAIIQFDEFARGKLEMDDISWSRKLRSMKQVLKENDLVSVKILSYNKERKLFSVGLKQIVENPWTNIEEKYPVGTIISGEVSNKIEAGIFLKVEPDLEGFISKKDLVWDENPDDYMAKLKIGQKLRAVVLAVDKGKKQFRLGIKQLSKDPFIEKIGNLSTGQIVKGVIAAQNRGGFVVKLENDIEAFLPFSEVSRKEKETLAEKTSIDSLIKEINIEKRKIVLSLRDLDKKEVEETLRNFKESKPVTLGDLWNEILKKEKKGE